MPRCSSRRLQTRHVDQEIGGEQKPLVAVKIEHQARRVAAAAFEHQEPERTTAKLSMTRNPLIASSLAALKCRGCAGNLHSVNRLERRE